MNRWLKVAALVLLILVSAMVLRNSVITAAAHGTGPLPPTPWVAAHGTGPLPPTPWVHGTGPLPPTPWKHGTGPLPPTPWNR
jgi:hypothetical protein